MAFGKIDEIHLEKKSQTDNKNYEQILDYYIKGCTTKEEKFQIVSVKKKPAGLRVAKIQMANPVNIPKVCTALNDLKGVLGQTRVFVTPHYYHPFLIVRGCHRMFEDFVEEIFKNSPPLKNKVTLRPVQVNNLHYIVVKSKNKDAFNLLVTQLQ